MKELLHTPITSMSQAEAWAASAPELASLPTFAQYKAGLETFLRESAEWHDIDQTYPFHSVNRYGYYKSSDNANGGLDVSWAFYKAHREVGYTRIFADEKSIVYVLDSAEAEYIRLCDEDRALTEENEE